MAVTLPRSLRTPLRKTLFPLRPLRAARLHPRLLRSRTRPFVATRLWPRILRTGLGLRTILRLLLAAPLHILLEALAHLLAALHLLREPLPPLLLKLLLALLPRLRATVAALRCRARTILRSRILRRRIASIIAIRSRRTPLALTFTALGSRLSWPRIIVTTIARTALHGAPIRLLEKFIACHPSIAPAIEPPQDFRRVLHLLLIDHAIVIRIEQIEERRSATHVARPTPTLPIRALLKIRTRTVAIASLRQARRRIRGRWRSLRTLRRWRGGRCGRRHTFLRVKQRRR